jgi:hypothetical protein
MNKVFYLLGLFLLSNYFSFSQCANENNIYKFEINGTKYELVKEKKNWEDAANCAVERGGFLAEIKTNEEQDAIYQAILKSGVSKDYNPVMDGGGISYIWIGATDKNEEGKWIWDGNNDKKGEIFWIGQGFAGSGDGEIIDNHFVNWGGRSKGKFNEPDNYNNSQNGAAIALDGWPKGTTMLGIASEWNDINTNNELYFIIEYPNGTGLNNSRNSNGTYLTFSNDSQLILKNIENFEKISIFDILGNEKISITSNKSNEIALSCNNFESGIYFILISSDILGAKYFKFNKTY